MSADDSQASPVPAGRRPVDPVALQRIARRLAQASPPPWLHGEVARRMAERLPLIKARPDAVLMWGGAGQNEIVCAYDAADPGAGRHMRFCPVDPALHSDDPDSAQADSFSASAALGQAGDRSTEPLGLVGSLRRWLGLARPADEGPLGRAGKTLRPSQVPPGSVGLVWSNMGLHLQLDPLATFRHWHRALVVDGFIMFSTLGPGSLPQLRRVYQQAGWGPAMAPLVDMHDLGDMLVQAGFADPVMDQETLVLEWPDAESALRELRTLGANADPGRRAGLRTRHWREQLLQALKGTASSDGRVSLSFEIAYGHAFRPPERARLQPETRIALQDMRAMVRLPSGSDRGVS